MKILILFFAMVAAAYGQVPDSLKRISLKPEGQVRVLYHSDRSLKPDTLKLRPNYAMKQSTVESLTPEGVVIKKKNIARHTRRYVTSKTKPFKLKTIPASELWPDPKN